MRRRPATEESTIARAKHFAFPASVEWEGGSLTVASIAGKQDLDVATPPGFGGENEEAWSPEDLLVAMALGVPVNVQTTVSSSEDAAPLPALHSAA